MPAANMLAGEGSLPLPPTNGAVRAPVVADTSDARAGNVVPDGTEWGVALIVLSSLAFLALLDAGGFRTMIAASISTGR